MKRTYTKPELFCEEYELSVSIAANCVNILNKDFAHYNDPNTCAYQVGRMTYFANSDVCRTVIDEGGTINGDLICYQNPAEDQTVFTS